jgi:hypothetical protein
MPKFGKEIDLVIEGIAKLLLASAMTLPPEKIRDIVLRP